jgi:D-glycero-D-manno-heptose 1,7-bisphosphate phosphatase
MGVRQVNRAVFLDRDGVINQVIIRDGEVFSPRSREEFLFIEESVQAIKYLKKAGFIVIVVTNQPDIARKRLSSDDLQWMTGKIMEVTEVDDIVICYHDDSDACPCRKPKAGMLLESSKKWKVDLSRSFMIGDTWKDVKVGQNAGCIPILLDAPYNKDVVCNLRVSSLTEALQIVLDDAVNYL